MTSEDDTDDVKSDDGEVVEHTGGCLSCYAVQPAQQFLNQNLSQQHKIIVAHATYWSPPIA